MTTIRNISILALCSALLLATTATVAAESSVNLDARADALLKKMSDYVAGIKSVTADAYQVEEQIMGDGFKMTVLQSGVVKLQRPDKFYILRKGDIGNEETFYNGSHLAILDSGLGRFIEIPVTGDVDAVLDAIAATFDAKIPGRDLFSTDAYTPLMEPVEESAYLGAVEINGIVCRHLAFRTGEVDWQLWIAEGNRPLPCRYTITSKWVFAAPQYTVTYTNWQVNPVIPSETFDFTAPDDAKPMTMQEYRTTLGSEGAN